MTAIPEFLPLFLRTSNLIESRRDTLVNMFLTGPSTNVGAMFKLKNHLESEFNFLAMSHLSTSHTVYMQA